MRKRDWLVAAGLVLSIAVLVGCGGSGGGGATGASEEQGLAFAECLRAHGVEVEDPQPGKQNIEVEDTGDPATKKALRACNGKLGKGQEMSSGEDEEFREGALALARCMRENGIEMGDPEFLGPGKFHLDIEGIDTESPAFEAARQACDEELPEIPGVTVGG